jgi:hypothetical protein
VSIRVNLWLGLLPLTGKRLKFIGSESLALSEAERVERAPRILFAVALAANSLGVVVAAV